LIRPFARYLIEDRQSYSRYIDAIDVNLKNTHKKTLIGDDEGLPIYLWESYKPTHLITAGWQGDEPSGWLACLELSTWEDNRGLSFLPVACPSAFILRQHWDMRGYNADRGFPKPRAESAIAINAVTDLLVSLASSGHISLQEDPHRSFAYVYSWGEAPTKKVVKILDDGPRRGLVMWDIGVRVPKKGGLFCEHLFENGVPYCIQTETPADGTVSIEKRTDAQIAVVKDLCSED
jgi:hypothetical protein